jgi:hypothetical protein
VEASAEGGAQEQSDGAKTAGEEKEAMRCREVAGEGDMWRKMIRGRSGIQDMEADVE